MQFYIIVSFFQIAQKVANHLLEILLPKPFKNRQIWTHWTHNN